jgi:hypothetical protein
MEARFFRLMIFISITGFLASLLYSGYCYYKETDLSSYVQQLGRDLRCWQDVCWDDKTPDYNKELACDRAKEIRSIFNNVSDARFGYQYKKEDVFKLAFIIPFLSISIFFALRWIITGKPTGLRRKNRG